MCVMLTLKITKKKKTQKNFSEGKQFSHVPNVNIMWCNLTKSNIIAICFIFAKVQYPIRRVHTMHGFVELNIE